MSDEIETALQGDHQEPISLGDGCDDSVNSGSCGTPSSSPLQFRVPVAQSRDEPGADEDYRHYDLVSEGITWPAKGFGSTVPVPKSDRYIVGQGIFVTGAAGRGWLVVSAKPSATSITLMEVGGIRSNPEKGTVLAGPIAVVPGPRMKPDTTYDDLKDSISEEIIDEVTKQVDAKIDKSPTFPLTTVKKANGGRLVVSVRKNTDGDGDDAAEYSEMEVGENSDGAIAVLKNEGCDEQAVRFDKWNPSSGAPSGELIAAVREAPCEGKPPAPRLVAPEIVKEDSVPNESFGMLGYREETVECSDGNIIKKFWQKLTKFILHKNFFFTPTTDDDTLHVLVSNLSGDIQKVGTLTLGNRQVLVGDDDGKLRVKDLFDVVPPSTFIPSGEPATLLSVTSNVTTDVSPNTQVAAPECATHAIVALRLKNANNSESTMTIDGVLRLSSGASTTSDPNTADTIAWIPLSAPDSTINVVVGSTDDPTVLAEVKLIGYQCNRPA